MADIGPLSDLEDTEIEINGRRACRLLHAAERRANEPGADRQQVLEESEAELRSVLAGRSDLEIHLRWLRERVQRKPR